RVEPELLQVGRRSLEAALRIGPHGPGVVGATDREWQVASTVRRDDLQIRMPVEHAREDHVRERHGVLRRLPYGVGQVETVETFVEAAAERVQEDHAAEL